VQGRAVDGGPNVRNDAHDFFSKKKARDPMITSSTDSMLSYFIQCYRLSGSRK